MTRSAARLAECVCRGYGQLFLANRVSSGLCVALGLLIASPTNGLLSLLGATTLTAAAMMRSTSDSLLKSGLYGVNGVLFGFAWVLFPEVDVWVRAATTVIVCGLVGLFLAPVAELLRDRTPPPFTIPYVLAMWGTLLALSATGRYDLRFAAGWSELPHDPARAERTFASIPVLTPRAEAHRQDGLGWASFHQHEYSIARAHFKSALAAWSEFADAHDGLGWCCLRLGDLDEAEAAFRSAVALDPRIGDAWDGLGWTRLARGDKDGARDCFRRAIVAVPLASASVAPSLRWTSSAQLACWAFFFVGVLLHSRTSAMIGLMAVALCVLSARLWPTIFGAATELPLLYNLVPLVLALGGHYLTLDRVTALWLVFVSGAMIVLWPTLTAMFAWAGLPMLCLPFNLFFVGSLLVFAGLRRLGIGGRLVPLDVAVTSPEEVRLWQRRRRIVRACWERIERG